MFNENKVDILVKSRGDTKGIDDTGKSLSGLNQKSKVASVATAGLGAAFKVAKIAAIAAGAAITAGAVAASKSAFDQVRAVEEASFALRAYEKDGKKVDKVLQSLVAYARSDMGVLFQRQDLFAAAQTLKLYGAETETLTDKVKILSKGVAVGGTTFQELSNIVGRAAAKGRLDAVDFDMLIERGIGLDKSMRGAAVTSEQLFKALNEAIPDSILKGRADTIQGRMIRMQSAFRDVGLSILGVDRDTSKFIKGGLGDRFLSGVESATNALKGLSKAVGPFLNQAIENTSTVLRMFYDLFRGNDPTIKQSELRFAGLSKAMSKVRSVVDAGYKIFQQYFLPSLKALFSTIGKDLMPALKDLWKLFKEDLMPVVKVLAIILGATIIAAWWLQINVLRILIKVLGFLINVFVEVVERIADFFREVKQISIDFYNAIIGTWWAIRDGTLQAWWAVREAIVSAWQGLFNSVISPVANAIMATMRVIGGVASYIWQWINALAMVAWNAIYNNAVAPVKARIVQALSALGQFASGIWNSIRNVAILAWQAVHRVAASAFNGITRAAGGAANWIRGHWNSLLSWFGGVWRSISGGASGAGRGITNVFSGVANSIKKAIGGAVNWVIDKINGLIRQVNGVADKVPGAPKLGEIPRFASGVKNFEGGMAVVGERGPELVSLPKGSNVYSNAQSKQMAGSSTSENHFHGNMYFQTADAVKEFFTINDRNGELAARGMSIARS